MSLIWQPTKWPLTDAEYQAQIPNVPDVAGGVILKEVDTAPKRGFFKTTWIFWGVNGDGKAPTFKGRNNSLDWKFEGGFAQVSVALAPGFQALLTEFQGTPNGDGTIFWPQLYTPSGGSGSSGLSSGNSQQQPNPMFGQQDFLRMEGTYSFRYAGFDYGSALQGVGTVFPTGALPGQPPPVADGRNWLKAPPVTERKGPVEDITEVYWLSGPLGWPPQYKSGGGSVGGGGVLGSAVTFSNPLGTFGGGLA